MIVHWIFFFLRIFFNFFVLLDFFEICLLDFIFFIFFLDFFFRFFSLSFFRFFPGRFDTSGFMIRLSVPEIEGGTLSATAILKVK